MRDDDFWLLGSLSTQPASCILGRYTLGVAKPTQWLMHGAPLTHFLRPSHLGLATLSMKDLKMKFRLVALGWMPLQTHITQAEAATAAVLAHSRLNGICDLPTCALHVPQRLGVCCLRLVEEGVRCHDQLREVTPGGRKAAAARAANKAGAAAQGLWWAG